MNHRWPLVLTLLVGCATGIAPPPDSRPDAEAGLGTSALTPDSGADEVAAVVPIPDVGPPDTQAVAMDTQLLATPDALPRDTLPALPVDSQPLSPDVSPIQADTGGPPVCVPGTSIACTCATGLQGAQVCSTACTYGVCDCQPVAPDAPVQSLLISGPADMGNVPIGTTAETTYTVQNTGGADVSDITIETTSTDFLLVHSQCKGKTLASQAVCTFGLSFSSDAGMSMAPSWWQTVLTATAPGVTSNHLKVKAWVVAACGNNCDGGRG